MPPSAYDAAYHITLITPDFRRWLRCRLSLCAYATPRHAFIRLLRRHRHHASEQAALYGSAAYSRVLFSPPFSLDIFTPLHTRADVTLRRA